MTALKKFNVVDHLENDEAIIGYLDACLEEGGPALFLKALGDLVKGVGLTRIASAAGIASRTSAYRSFSENGTPSIARRCPRRRGLDARPSPNFVSRSASGATRW